MLTINIEEKIIPVGGLSRRFIQGESNMEPVQFVLPGEYNGVNMAQLSYTLKLSNAAGTMTGAALTRAVSAGKVMLGWAVTEEFTRMPGECRLEIDGVDTSGIHRYKAVSSRFEVIRNLGTGSNLPPKDEITAAVDEVQRNVSEAAERVADAASWANRAKGYSDQAKQSAATVDTKVQAAQDVTNALTAATGTANSSNTTLQTAINQAKAALKNLQDAIGEAELENYLSATGTAVAAKKLETARTITATGAVKSDPVAFDGTKNIVLNMKDNSVLSGSTKGKWYKIASTNSNVTTSNYPDLYAVFLVQWCHNDALDGFGILRAHLRIDKPNKRLYNIQFKWDYSGTHIEPESFVLAYKDWESDICIYHQTTRDNESVKFTLIQSQSGLAVNDNFSTWTLYNQTESAIPSDYTQVPSTYSNLNTGVINSLGLNLRKDPSGTISYPFYFYAGTNGEKLIKINSGQETVNDIVYPTLAIRCSTDNGATWTVIGNFINSDAISKPYDIVTKGYADAQYFKNTGGMVTGDLDIAAPSTGAYHLRMSALGTNPDNGNNGIERVDISALAKNNSSRPVPALWFTNVYAGNVRSVILSNIHNPVSNTDAVPKGYADYIPYQYAKSAGFPYTENIFKRSIKSFPFEFTFTYNGLSTSGYQLIAKSNVTFSTAANTNLIIEGFARAWGSTNRCKIVINNQSANKISFAGIGDSALVVDLNIVVVTNSENKVEVYLQKETTAARWYQINLKISVEGQESQWTVNPALKTFTLTSGTIPGTKVWDLKTAWGSTSRTQITKEEVENGLSTKNLTVTDRVNGLTLGKNSHGDMPAFTTNQDSSAKSTVLVLTNIKGTGSDWNDTIIIEGLGDAVNETQAVNLRTLNNRLATLEAKLTGKTVAEVMTANAVAASIPNEAPTLEAPGEEEITV